MRKKNIVVVMIFIMAIFMVGCNNSQNDSSVNENIQQESVEERTFSDYDQYVTEYGGTQGFCFPDIGWKAEPF